jgi:hypothetical protein
MPLYDQITQSQVSIVETQQMARKSTHRASIWNNTLLAQASVEQNSQSASQTALARIDLVIPFSMSLPKAWVDHAPKEVKQDTEQYGILPKSTVYRDTDTSAEITESHRLPNWDDSKLGLLIPTVPNRVIFDERNGSASPLAKKFASLAGHYSKYNQLTTSKSADWHISKIETITVSGRPAVRFSSHNGTIPIEKVIIPLATGEKKKFLPGISASDQTIIYSADNDKDFNKSKNVFEEAIKSIR